MTHDVYNYSECNEVAANMRAPRFANLDEAYAWVKAQMPDETMTVRGNVAISLFESQRDARRKLIKTQVCGVSRPHHIAGARAGPGTGPTALESLPSQF